MNHTNLISAYQSIIAIDDSNIDKRRIKPLLNLRIHEARTLQNFCNILSSNSSGLQYDFLDGFYVGYKIKQISKEFDLLRFGINSILNIELKSELELSQADKIETIREQMRKNYYYLKLLSKPVNIFTFVQNDGLYMYNHLNNTVTQVDFDNLIETLSLQSVDYSLNPDDLFVPSRYLISPFNNTKRFMEENYFLNDAQISIKSDILGDFNNNLQKYYCISANAGTGKTLLLFDIVKTMIDELRNPLIIHCGILNPGHSNLINTYNWNIKPIKYINKLSVTAIIPVTTDIILIDESQRINDSQLEIIIERAKELNIMVVFSYDTKQFLRKSEKKDISSYLKTNHPDIIQINKELKNKIRTNKEISSFITNLIEIGRSNSNLNYEKVTISYFDDYEDAKKYMKYLYENHGWMPLTYSDSTFNTESISPLAKWGFTNAHNILGQEFEKVVFPMDSNFHYSNGKLQVSRTYYSLEGMLYQIVTRVVNDLKIIVVDNPELYSKLLEIKLLESKSQVK